MLTPDEIERMRREHAKDEFGDCATCHEEFTYDGNRWPCDAAKLLAELDRLLALHGDNEYSPALAEGLRWVPFWDQQPSED